MIVALVVSVVVALAVGVLIGVATSRRRAASGPPTADAPAAPADSPARRRDAGGAASVVESLPRALWSLPLGLVVAEADGTVVYRNAVASSFADARHGQALVEAAIRELIVASAAGGQGERIVDLYGPPRRRLVVKAAPMQVERSTAGCLVIIEDVTEQQRVDTVRRDFVANVSHELKTPVGAIGVLAEALQGEDDPQVIERLAGRLEGEAMRLGHTIEDLLALSRIEAGELFQPTELDLDELVTLALERTASPAERRQVTVTAERAPAPVVVRGDRGQLVSAVGNLVDNAIKYSDPGSTVVVSVSEVDGRGCVSVRDRGIGIPASDLERIFERFYRVDPARSRSTGGTGLGLSIVRHVVLNHGGEVTVRSTEGDGSTFALLLPLAAGAGTGVGSAGTTSTASITTEPAGARRPVASTQE